MDGSAMPAPALNRAPSFARPAAALSVLTLPNAPYILHLLSLSSSPLTLAASEDGVLRTFDRANLSKPAVRSWKWDAGGNVTSLKAAGAQGWIASGSGGLVGCWDGRAAGNEPTMSLKGPSGAAYLSAATSSNGHTLAAGTELSGVDAAVEIWDVRAPAAPVHTYSESHSDDVTSLSFHPSSSHSEILLSGSTDGLLCTYDTRIADEDDAVLSVGNTGASLARAGWGAARAGAGAGAATPGPDAAERRGLGGAWAVSDMQTLSVWDADAFDTLLAPMDARGPTSVVPQWTTDYVIDCIASGDEGLLMFMGDQSGAMALVTVPAPTALLAGAHESAQTASKPWTIQALMPSSETSGRAGHGDIVRCVEWDAATGTLLTGGEDGRLCSWDLNASSSGADEDGGAGAIPSHFGVDVESPTSRSSTGREKAKGASGKGRYTPYG